jgi:hypothetical protein
LYVRNQSAIISRISGFSRYPVVCLCWKALALNLLAITSFFFAPSLEKQG